MAVGPPEGRDARFQVVKLAVLASGSGTILEAFLDAGLPVGFVLVDRPCRALSIAAEHDVPGQLIERTSFGKDFDRVGYTNQVVHALAAAETDLIAMAGYGTILDDPMYDAFAGRIVNTHPSLLPSFPGWHAVDDAVAFGVKVTGCTIHVATREVDAGPILAQEAVTIHDDDTVESLHERIKTVERRLYLETLQRILHQGYVLTPGAGTSNHPPSPRQPSEEMSP